MKEKGKMVLIILALVAFLTVGVLLIAQIGNIGKAAVYDANGCPKDGNTWTYDIKTNKCTSYANPTIACTGDEYKWSASLQKCYKKAVYANNTYNCPSSDTKVTNSPFLGNGTYCTRNADKKCNKSKSMPSNATAVLDGGKCKFMITSKKIMYTITYNSNGGVIDDTSYKYTKSGNSIQISETVTYDSIYYTKKNMFKKTGYIFVGWNEKANGKGTNWTSYINKKWTWSYKKNVTLYAQWKKVPIADNKFYECVIDSFLRYNNKSYKYTTALTAKDLSTLKGLSCSNNFTSADGIQYMTGITKLTIENNNSIKELNLSNNYKLTYIELRSLKNLNTLNLKNIKSVKLIIDNAPKLGFSFDEREMPNILSSLKVTRSPFVQKWFIENPKYIRFKNDVDDIIFDESYTRKNKPRYDTEVQKENASHAELIIKSANVYIHIKSVYYMDKKTKKWIKFNSENINKVNNNKYTITVHKSMCIDVKAITTDNWEKTEHICFIVNGEDPE